MVPPLMHSHQASSFFPSCTMTEHDTGSLDSSVYPGRSGGGVCILFSLHLREPVFAIRKESFVVFLCAILWWAPFFHLPYAALSAPINFVSVRVGMLSFSAGP